MLVLKSGRAGRLLVSALIAMGAVILAAGPAMADVDIFTKGKVGEHHLNDTPENGGGVCKYTVGGHLKTFRIRAPVVYAIDRNSARNRGLVGWLFLIDTYDPNSAEPAYIFYKSGVQYAWAWDDTPADFSAMSVSPPVPHNDNVYRLFVKMFWYRADGSVKGASVHVITEYKQKMGDWSNVNYGNCPGTLVT